MACHTPPPDLLLPIRRAAGNRTRSPQRFSEQQLALLPVSTNGPVRYAQSLSIWARSGRRRCAARRPGPGADRVPRLVERFMNGEDLFCAPGALISEPRLQRDVGRASAAPMAVCRARKIDDDRPHHASGPPTQEVHTVLEVQGSGRGESQIRSCTSEPVSSSVSRPPASRIRASLQRLAYVAVNSRSATSAAAFWRDESDRSGRHDHPWQVTSHRYASIVTPARQECPVSRDSCVDPCGGDMTEVAIVGGGPRRAL